MHHCPPEPGSVRSILFPHMGVHGSQLDMLKEDSVVATRLAVAAERHMSDDYAAWQAATGAERAKRRHYLRLTMQRYRSCDRAAREAFGRLSAYTVTRIQAAA